MQSTGNPATGKTSEAPVAARIIKRYANRKLYDTRDSRYVTLQQIGEFVRDGQDVKIIDNTSKEDLTSATLAQIVYEAEKNNPETAKAGTMGALRDLIQNGGEKLITSLREGPMGKLIARREEGAPATVTPEKPVAAEKPAGALENQRKNLLLHPKDAIDELQRLADERVNVVLGTAIQSVHQLQNEVKRLQGRIEELETKLVAVQQRRGQAGDDMGREKETDPSDR
jgi:polyhydroxyalkanoate synthesis repressor PhaR